MLAVLDSCNNGTVDDDGHNNWLPMDARIDIEREFDSRSATLSGIEGDESEERTINGTAAVPWSLWGPHSEGVRLLPQDVAAETYRAHPNDYQPAFTNCPPETPRGASVLIITACSDDSQGAIELADHGQFTERLLTVWSGGQYNLPGYQTFVDRIADRMKEQQPLLYDSGPKDAAFKQQIPFTI